MRIALVSLARRGGMVHFLAELADALSGKCEVVVVIAGAVPASYFAREVAILRLETGATPLQSALQSVNLLMWIRLARQLAALSVDLVHVVGVHQWNPLIAIISRLLGAPLVYTVHDPNPHPGSPLSIAVTDRAAARMAQAVVVLTRHGRRQLLQRGFAADNVSVIPHPTYTLFRRWRPSSHKLHQNILYFGRIEEYKGLDVLVAAFRSIQHQLRGWTLVIAGSGALPSRLANLKDAQIVVRSGYASDPQVARLMHSAAIVALPYTSATQSGVIALARAFGRPVIATAVGGLKEMIVEGRTGLLVPPGDIEALADAIKSLAGHPRRLARMQRSVAAADGAVWNPTNVAGAHARLYARVLKKHRGR